MLFSDLKSVLNRAISVYFFFRMIFFPFFDTSLKVVDHTQKRCTRRVRPRSQWKSKQKTDTYHSINPKYLHQHGKAAPIQSYTLKYMSCRLTVCDQRKRQKNAGAKKVWNKRTHAVIKLKQKKIKHNKIRRKDTISFLLLAMRQIRSKLSNEMLIFCTYNPCFHEKINTMQRINRLCCAMALRWMYVSSVLNYSLQWHTWVHQLQRVLYWICFSDFSSPCHRKSPSCLWSMQIIWDKTKRLC